MMQRFWALVEREFLEWRLLILGALLIGFCPPLAPWIPGFQHHDPEDIQQLFLVLSALPFIALAVVLTGGSLLSHDLAEKRLGFFVARPFSDAQLWLGKVVGALTVLILCTLFLTAPTLWIQRDAIFRGLEGLASSKVVPLVTISSPFSHLFVHARADLPYMFSPWWIPGILALVLLLAMLVVHWLAITLRARTPLVWVDLLGAGAVTAILWTTFDRLDSAAAMGPLVWLERGLLAPLAMIFLVAGIVQVRWGRTDLERSHRALALGLWPPLLTVAVLAWAWAGWVLSPSINDLEGSLTVKTAPQGPWTVIGGRGAGRAGGHVAFLFDPDTGRSHRLGGQDPVNLWSRFSQDGKRFVWPRCDRLRPIDCELWSMELGSGPLEPRALGISLDSQFAALALSPTGQRLTLRQNKQLTVHDLDTQRLLTSSRAPEYLEMLEMPDEDTVRYWAGLDTESGWHTEHFQVRLDAPRSTHISTVPFALRHQNQCRGEGFDHLLVESYYPVAFSLVHAPTGEVLASYRKPKPVQWRCLGDGRVVLVFLTDGSIVLRVLGRDGSEIGHSSLGPTAYLNLGAEHRPGALLMTVSHQETRTSRLFEITVGDTPSMDGTLSANGTQSANGIQPADGTPSADETPSAPDARLLATVEGDQYPLVPALMHRNGHSVHGIGVGAPATRLFFVREGRTLLRLDPVTERLEPVFDPDR